MHFFVVKIFMIIADFFLKMLFDISLNIIYFDHFYRFQY